MNIYLYHLDGAVYVNLTNRCTNNCTFCIRNTHDGVGGYHLLIDSEPDAGEIITALKKENDLDHVIFCGFGEPTLRIGVLLEVARYLKTRGSHIRINTNGQGSAFAGYDIVPAMRGLIDTVSISLNAPDPITYQCLCQSIYGEDAYRYVMEFAQSCVTNRIETILTAVDVLPKDQLEDCRQTAAAIGAQFRIRPHIG